MHQTFPPMPPHQNPSYCKHDTAPTVENQGAAHRCFPLLENDDPSYTSWVWPRRCCKGEKQKQEMLDGLMNTHLLSKLFIMFCTCYLPLPNLTASSTYFEKGHVSPPQKLRTWRCKAHRKCQKKQPLEVAIYFPNGSRIWIFSACEKSTAFLGLVKYWPKRGCLKIRVYCKKHLLTYFWYDCPDDLEKTFNFETHPHDQPDCAVFLSTSKLVGQVGSLCKWAQPLNVEMVNVL